VALSFASAVRLAAFAFLLWTGCLSDALADDAATPPASPQQAAPDTAAARQTNCIDETGDFASHGNVVTYVIGFQNKCEKRLRCTLDAYVVGPKGPTSGTRF
jgi:hypothetical protein